MWIYNYKESGITGVLWSICDYVFHKLSGNVPVFADTVAIFKINLLNISYLKHPPTTWLSGLTLSRNVGTVKWSNFKDHQWLDFVT